MKVSVFGAGYVGCVTAASLASLGHTVWLVESSPSKLSLLQRSQCPVVEPGLEELLSEHIKQEKILPTGSSEEAVHATDLALLCVGTPSLGDGTTDIRQVLTVCQQINQDLLKKTSPYVVVLRSTMPYPMIQSSILPALEQALPQRFGKSLFFAFNPEFLREGKALEDFRHPPFVVIGTDHPQASEALQALYKGIEAPFHIVSLGAASLLKYACNAFHALKITFANEIASLSPLFSADANQTMDLFCQDTALNISRAYLRPGYAFGGSCLPKDLKTLGRLSALSAISTPLLDSIEKSNRMLIEKTVQAIDDYGLRKVGLIGLTFKGGTDDFRNSPLVELAERLIGKGFELAIYDPDIDLKKIHGQNLSYIRSKLPHLAQALHSDFNEVAQHAELLIVGKILLASHSVADQFPARCVVLDLTRQIPQGSQKPRVLHLEDLVQIQNLAGKS